MNVNRVSKKIANNILEFLFDPTVIPVKQRVYFGPEEKLMNESYEKAKEDARGAYHDQKHNSDMYPIRNRSTHKEGSVMDRKTLIASLDILAKNFASENDPFATELRTMASAISEITDDVLQKRLAADAPVLEETVEAKKMEMFPCPKCGTKVMKQTGYCLKCKKKVQPKKADDDTKCPECEKDMDKCVCKESAEKCPDCGKAMKDCTCKESAKKCPKCGDKECTCKSASMDFWPKEASKAVAKALLADAGVDVEDDAEDEEESVEHEKSETPEEEEKEHAPAPKKDKEEAPPTPAPAPEDIQSKKKSEMKTPEMKPEEKKEKTKKEDVEAANQNKSDAFYPKKKKEAEAPAPEDKKDDEKEAPVPEKDDVEAKKAPPAEKDKIVNTAMLATEKFDDLELKVAMFDDSDIKISADEKAQLDQLFK